MKHDKLEESVERKEIYRVNLRRMDDNSLLQVFIGVYLDQGFQTEFDRWMADQDILELKRRFGNR